MSNPWDGHTPGPWKCNAASFGETTADFQVEMPGGAVIKRANIELVAAAPDLAARVAELEDALRQLMLAHWATKEWDNACERAIKVLGLSNSAASEKG